MSNNYLLSHKTDWLFTQYEFGIKYREEFEFTERDAIICNLINELGDLNENGLKSIEFARLGMLLGFAMKNLKVSGDIIFTKDLAEINIFKAFLTELEEFHLLKFNDTFITLTKWGSEGILNNKKYKFFEGTANLYKFLLFDYDEFEAGFFPFYRIGLEPSISKNKDLKEPYELDSIFSNEQSDNLEKLWFNIENSSQTNFKIDFIEDKPQEQGVEKTISLYCNLLTFMPSTISIALNDYVFKSLTSELNRKKNFDKNVFLKLKSEWLYLLRKTDKLIGSNLILTYHKHIEWKILFEQFSDRINWSDDYIIKVLFNSEINIYQVSKYTSIYCPIEKVKEHISLFNEFGIWEVLSERFDSEYILNNPLLNWSIPIVIQNLAKTSNDLEEFITLNKENLSIEDWTDVTKLISDDFVEKNIVNFPLNLSLLQSEKSELCKKLILKYPNLNWNIDYIYSGYGIDYLADNYQIFNTAPFLRINRFFESLLENKSLNEIKEYSNIELIIKDLRTSNYKINKQKVPLTLNYIDFYEQNQLIQWGEKNISGFEANPHLIWTDDIFRSYQHNLLTDGGLYNASLTASITTVNTFRSFKWDKKVLYSRKEIVNNIEFLKAYEVPEGIENIPFESDFLVKNFTSFFINTERLSGSVIELLNQNLSIGSFIELYKDESQINVENWDFIRLLQNSTRIEAENNIHWLSDLFQTIKNKSTPENIESFSIQLNQICSLFKIMNTSSLEIWDWDYISENKMYDIDKKSWKDWKIKFESIGYYLNWPIIIKKYFKKNFLSKTSTIEKLVDYINYQNIEKQEEAWEALTRKVDVNFLWDSINEQIENKNSKHNKFKWSWDVISSSPDLMKDRFNDEFLYKEEYYFNNTLLTQNKHFAELLKYNNIRYTNRNQWKSETVQFLENFEFVFDWSVLSEYSEITSYYRILNRFRKKWDWIKIGANSKNFLEDKVEDNLHFLNLKQVKFYKKENDFLKGLTSRNDAIYSKKFIKLYKDANLNWQHLSGYNGTKLSNEMLIELAQKDWDFKLLSHRADLKFNNELFNKLIDQRPVDAPQWDWEYFSDKPFLTNDLVFSNKDAEWNWEKIADNYSDNLVFDEKLIRLLSNRENIDWYSVSSKNKLHINYTTLNLLFNKSEGRLNWKNITNNEELDIEKLTSKKGEEGITLLEKYENYWDWEILIDKLPGILTKDIISKFSHKIHKTLLSKYIPTNLIIDFREKLNWKILTRRNDVLDSLNNEMLEEFKYYWDWSVLSANYKHITEQILDKYAKYWDWIELSDNFQAKKNRVVYKRIETYLNENPILKLVKKLSQSGNRWAGKVYHYTHLSNAIKIINEGKIKSRNTAEQINNIAGTVYKSKTDPHKFARFYFRPLTPNQFYNEDFGIQDTNSKFYDRWVGMDYPKCLLPVMFEIDCKELLKINQKDIWASNGNMQAKKTKYNELNSIINRMDFDNMFCDNFGTEEGKQAAQQELLVLKELDLSLLNSLYVKVKCTNKFVESQIKKYCSNSPLMDNLFIDTSNFNRQNKSLSIDFDENNLKIKANIDDCYFIITINNSKVLLNVDEYLSNNYEMVDLNTFKFYNYVEIYNYESFEYRLEYVDNQPIETKQKWSITHNISSTLLKTSFGSLVKS